MLGWKRGLRVGVREFGTWFASMFSPALAVPAFGAVSAGPFDVGGLDVATATTTVGPARLAGADLERRWRAAERRYLDALPSLLRQPKQLGLWVAYAHTGLVDSDPSERALRERLHGRFHEDELLVARVEPLIDEVFVPAGWLDR